MTISIQNLSIVIVSFHSEDVIHDCIKSITDEIEIIVVENSGNKDFATELENKYKLYDLVIKFMVVRLEDDELERALGKETEAEEEKKSAD